MSVCLRFDMCSVCVGVCVREGECGVGVMGAVGAGIVIALLISIAGVEVWLG